MDQGTAQIQILLLVDAAVVADKVSGGGADQQILQNRPVAAVDVLLGGAPQIDEPKAAGRALHPVQAVKNEGVVAVVVPAPLCQTGVVLGGVEQRIAGEFAVVQPGFAVVAPELVVPVHHCCLVAGVHGVVVDVMGQFAAVGGVLHKGIALMEQIPIHQLHQKHIPALLNITDPRLPEEADGINAADGDILLFPVPKNAVDAGAAAKLVVGDVGIGLLKIVLLQNHRQHLAEPFRQRPILGLPGQQQGSGEVVHGIGVLGADGVEQPAAGRLRVLPAGAATGQIIPVAQLVPLLVGDEALLQRRLPGLVFLQNSTGHGDLLCPYGGDFLIHSSLLHYAKISSRGPLGQ